MVANCLRLSAINLTVKSKGLFTPSKSGNESEKDQGTNKKITEQEGIPVGCVPSIAVAVSEGCLSRGCLPDSPVPVDRMTDMCKNVTVINNKHSRKLSLSRYRFVHRIPSFFYLIRN